ncbi:hypothetical protein Aoki45_23140 [Algoriphagus sp. oki45]|uniref:hypothetical protein n=1 Tax=Algoriphagus sp. oki45 TaxID=3067294 RepID=UPI0027F511CA|nr:hypothetical protein Aoki45_23140 [Algoriphagus sp. oki45]
MNILYSRLFEVQLLHDFFADGVAQTLGLSPDTSTQNLLKSGRMLTRSIPKGLIVLYRAEENLSDPEIRLQVPCKFRFFINSSNSGFLHTITDWNTPQKDFKTGSFFHFKNNPANSSANPASLENLEYQILDGLRPKTLLEQVKLSSSPTSVIFRVRDESGNQVSSGKDSAGNPLPLDLSLSPDDLEIFSLRVDFKGKEDGIYSLELRNQADTETLFSKTYFFSGDAIGNTALGIIEISYVSSPARLYGTIDYYAIRLKRKSTRWTYIIVNQNKKLNLGTNQLSIRDRGNPQGTPYGIYTFQQEGGAPHPDIKINNAETVIFKSQVPIPFFESPKLNLELRRTPGNRVLYANLPNPLRNGIAKINGGEAFSEIFVFI